MPSSEVMHKWKAGTLHSGSPTGPRVTTQRQAVAIMLSEKANERKHGGHYRSGTEAKPEHSLHTSPGTSNKFGKTFAEDED